MIRITARRSALVAASVAAALLLSACSSGDGISAIETPAERDAASNVAPSAGKSTKPTQTPKATEKSSKAQAKTPKLAANAFVPSVDVLDVRSGNRLDLQSVVPSDRPVLLWAWAPHCPSCRREAPALEQFAAANQDAIKVVGIGTQDDQAYAEEFLSTTGVNTPQMLWDPSFESWRVMGITAQPTWVLVRGDGSLITGWVGGFPEQQILSAIQAA